MNRLPPTTISLPRRLFTVRSGVRNPSAFNAPATFAALRSSLLNSKTRRAMGASEGSG
ncbi:MAG: hypothetical protein H7A54_04350 [Akkermansiaceae bacterium]|nr:hypothetical protein [Akkermansiaceae bacterium]